MSDGREEREEQRKRIEQERQNPQDDRGYRDHTERWQPIQGEPERVDS